MFNDVSNFSRSLRKQSVIQTLNLFTVSWQLGKKTSQWASWGRGNDMEQRCELQILRNEVKGIVDSLHVVERGIRTNCSQWQIRVFSDYLDLKFSRNLTLSVLQHLLDNPSVTIRHLGKALRDSHLSIFVAQSECSAQT